MDKHIKVIISDLWRSMNAVLARDIRLHELAYYLTNEWGLICEVVGGSLYVNGELIKFAEREGKKYPTVGIT